MRNKAAPFIYLTVILGILLPVGVTEAFSGAGSGTEEDPYIIANVYQLQEINQDSDAWYELGNDIDASDTINWNGGEGFEPIGFSGNLDGRGHKITGLYINRGSSSNIALFSSTSNESEIKNVGLINVNITGRHLVASLSAANRGTITCCYSTGSVSSTFDSNVLGGLVGVNNGVDAVGTISDCYSTASVNGGAYSAWVGGFVAHNYWGAISNCYSAGSIHGYSITGGFVGDNDGGTCNNCFWDRDIGGFSSACGTGKTTAQMKQKTTFTNWDFVETWDIEDSVTYPFLLTFLPSHPISDPVSGTATQAGSGLDETDPDKMVEIANGDVCIKFVPLVSGGGSVTITELSCRSINGDGVYIIENTRGIRAITALDNGDFVSTLKVFYVEEDIPAGWTEKDIRIMQLQGLMAKLRWIAELMLDMLPEPQYGPPTTNIGDLGVDEEGNYVWANVDHFTDYGVGVKLVTGDYDSNKKIDFLDFSHFAFHWQDANCPDFEWCEGTDFDFSTIVDFNDLLIFTDNWLYDANDPNTW